MATVNSITVILPDADPLVVDLDQFRREYVLMGRGPGHGDSGQQRNDIALDQRYTSVSRAHCHFQRDSRGDWYIVDDGSMNGLIFQDEKIDAHRLSDGDKLYIGDGQQDNIVILFSHRENGSMSVGTSLNGVKSYSLQNISQFVIGRASDCDIVINHPMVSRRHCIITRENGSYYITDNNSTNGVILNSAPLLEKKKLRQMDQIGIGGYSFVFSNARLYSYELAGGVSITAEHVTKSVGKKGQKKTILDNVSLSIEPNKFVAIIGGSGAGKTTLLNCLSGMSDFEYGKVFINGQSVRTNRKSLQSLIGYVPQQDIVYDSLTLERMLYYSAKLRMPPDVSEKEIRSKIDETLRLVELTPHRKTMISKLSGGERKRASIAVELLVSPKLFFLDEPSSGLDPGTEKHLMQMLRRLAETGRTVVMITHTVQNIDLCDSVICMGRGGRLCFVGSPQEATAFFGKRQMTDVYDELNEHSAHWAQLYAQQPQMPRSAPRKRNTPEKEKRSLHLWRDFTVMTSRYVEILWNSRARLILLMVMPILLTLLVCVAFQADGGIYNFLQRHGALIERKTFPFAVGSDTQALMFSFSCAAFWTGIFNSVQEISKERSIYERERFSGIGVTPYVLSKVVPLCVLCFIQSLCMVLIISAMTTTTATLDGNTSNTLSALKMSMPRDGVVMGEGMMGLENLITTFLCAISAMSLGLLISSIASNEMALVLCPICLMPQILFSGVTGELTGLTKLISNFISCRWSLVAFLVSARVNDMKDSYKNVVGIWEATDYSSGQFHADFAVDKLYSNGMNGVEYGWLILFVMFAVFAAAAVGILYYKKNHTR